MWEAQFGDFSNGGQVIIDNYVAAGEAKWGTVSGIVLLLPHGFEGQGPEHSSGHLERYLMLCARNNIQVCNCTTPAQYFHLLRNQALRSFRKPLVVMTPKSLLRNPRAVSPLRDLSGGTFLETLDDPAPPPRPRRLVLCAGKVFYDLLAARERKRASPVSIVRIEQLHPFPEERLAAVLQAHAGVTDLAWVQEEPRNRGAWLYVKERFDRHFPRVALRYVGREESASPATGSHARHEREQKQITDAALAAAPAAKAGKRAQA
jgi:2-oxoglutarate dehydrogenase E1 component